MTLIATSMPSRSDDPRPLGAARPVHGPEGPVRGHARTRSSRPCGRSPRARPTSSARRWRRSRRRSPHYVGARHCVGVNSGTSALHLALICAGVRPGDEVITVPMTFVATSWAISYVGADPGLRGRRSGRPTRWTCARSSGGSRGGPGRSCRSTCTDSRPTWSRCWRSAAAAASRSSRTRRRHTGHSTRDGGPARWGSAAASASTPARTWAPTARPARSSPTTARSPTGSAGPARPRPEPPLPPRRDRLQLPDGRLPGGRPGRQAQVPRCLDRGAATPGRAVPRTSSRAAAQAARSRLPAGDTSGTCSSYCTPTGTGSVASWKPGESRPACTTRSPSTCRRPTPTWNTGG